jgi:NAD(P)-dependent dehydrogenase (short-subunit alcohol dehydrogenase family)
MEIPTYIVFGATGGMGSEVSRGLASKGHRVVLVGRSAPKLDTLSTELMGSSFEIDVTDSEAVEQVCRKVLEEHGRLDGLANCVGSLLLKPAHLTSPADWKATIDTNLGSAFAVVRAAGRVMTDGGSVVLVSSAAARLGLANHEAIAAAKAGVIGLALSAAATYGNRGLRFNAVAPGLVKTPMTERITQNEAAVKSSEAMHALGKLGEPGDVARMITWLLDPEQTWVTGQVFGIDGGLATVRTRKG